MFILTFYVQKVHTIIAEDRQARLDIRSTFTKLDSNFKSNFNSDSAIALLTPDIIPLFRGQTKMTQAFWHSCETKM
jgi:hypothetical protein